MKLFASKTEREDLKKRLEGAQENTRMYFHKWNDALQENTALKAENEALRADLNEYREIFCNKQKALDAANRENAALRAQVEQMRDYITEMENKSRKSYQKTLSAAQKYVLDAWNAEHPEMAMTPKEFLGI